MVKQFLRLGARMGIGFASVVLVFTIVILATYVNMLRVDESVTLIREFNVPKLAYASEMRASMFHMRLAMLRTVNNRGNRNQNVADVRRHRAALLTNIEEFEKRVQLYPFPEETIPLRIIKENLAAIIPFQEELIRNPGWDIDSDTFIRMSQHAYIVIEQNDKLMSFERDRISYRTDLVSEKVKATERLFIIALSIGIALAALMSFLMTRSVTQPVEDMRLRWWQWQNHRSSNSADDS